MRFLDTDMKASCEVPKSFIVKEEVPKTRKKLYSKILTFSSDDLSPRYDFVM